MIIFSIGLTGWPQYAAPLRGATLVEKNKEYAGGACHRRLQYGHHVPARAAQCARAGAGDRHAQHRRTRSSPRRRFRSLALACRQRNRRWGTLISEGQNFLFSGEWWITVFPGIALIVMVISVNLVGDWLRDALNPKLR